MTLEERIQQVVGRLVFENIVLAQQVEELKAAQENGSNKISRNDVQIEKAVR